MADQAPAFELRVDPLTGVQVQVTRSRQARPNRPAAAGCPFCVGGVEAPEPYLVKAFTNRWPSFPDDRCEVVLYAPEHDAELSRLPPEHVRAVVDLWAERSADLGGRPDLAYVLASAWWGRGLASEAVQAMVADLHQRHGVRVLHAVLKSANLRSLSLLQRMGFVPATSEEEERAAIDADERLMVRVLDD